MTNYVIAGTVEIPSGRRLDVKGIELLPGTTTFIRGPSGCGKTSLFRKLCGSTQYGGSLGLSPTVDKLAFVTHDTTLIPWLTIDGNLTLEARMRGVAAPEADFAKQLAILGLAGQGDLRCRTLSLGMRQRAEIARALAFSPDLLLLDEAWSGVDAQRRSGVFTALDGFLTKTGACILATTHADLDVLRFGDRLYLFEDSVLSTIAVENSIPRARRMCMGASDLWKSQDLADMVVALGK